MSQVAYLTNIKSQCLHLLLIHYWAATDSLFLTTKKIDEEICQKSNENLSNFNLKSTKTLPWTGLCGAVGGLGWQVGDQGRLWQVLEPPNLPDGAVLSSSWSHVGAQRGVKICIRRGRNLRRILHQDTKVSCASHRVLRHPF